MGATSKSTWSKRKTKLQDPVEAESCCADLERELRARVVEVRGLLELNGQLNETLLRFKKGSEELGRSAQLWMDKADREKDRADELQKLLEGLGDKMEARDRHRARLEERLRIASKITRAMAKAIEWRETMIDD